jgi:hypothetical protein
VVAQNISGTDLDELLLVGEALGLRAFTCTGRAEKNHDFVFGCGQRSPPSLGVQHKVNWAPMQRA